MGYITNPFPNVDGCTNKVLENKAWPFLNLALDWLVAQASLKIFVNQFRGWKRISSAIRGMVCFYRTMAYLSSQIIDNML